MDDLTPKLASALDEDASTCAKALRELLARGVTEATIRASIAVIPGPMGVWDWKHTLDDAGPKRNGWARPPAPVHIQPDSHGATLAKIAADKVRAQADLEAFKASGYATRREWLKARKANGAA